jgi:hypothetical protein
MNEVMPVSLVHNLEFLADHASLGFYFPLNPETSEQSSSLSD